MSAINKSASEVHKAGAEMGLRGGQLGSFVDAVSAFRAFNERAQEVDVQLAKSIFGSARAEQERRASIHAKAVRRRRKRKKGGPK